MNHEPTDESVPSNCCVRCKSLFVWGPMDFTPGRVYSEDGVRETHISRLCETCFDDITAEPDPDDEIDV